MQLPFREEYRNAASEFMKHKSPGKIKRKYRRSPHIESIMRHITGQVEVKASEIPPSDDEWFKITEDAEYWPAYLELLNDPERKNMQGPAVSIDISTTNILNRLFDPESIEENQSNQRYGMVVGYVQSGKTAHYTGLIAKAADSGYKLIVVLSGLYNDLREQTQARLCKELTGVLEDPKGCDLSDVVYSRPWHHPTQPGIGKDFHEMAEYRNLSMITDKRPTLVVTKKNKSPLQALIEWVMGLSPSERAKIPLLLIDDECDYASLNTNAPKPGDTMERDPNRINALLREFLSLFENRAYIGYTASPFANVFIHPDGDGTRFKTLYPRDFVISLPPPSGYQGFASLFPTEGEHKGPIRIVPERDQEKLNSPNLEADIVRTLTDDPYADPTADMDEYPQLKKAFASYVISGSIRTLRGQGDKHHSMLIHTKHTKKSMKPIQKLVASASTVWRESLKRRDPNVLHGHHLDVYEYIMNYYIDEYCREIDNPPPWEQVHEGIRIFFRKGIRVLEINSDTSANSKRDENQLIHELNYDQYKEGSNVIAIGGNRLSRGLTLEGLCVSYFIRRSTEPKADTMMQMGRWFGYRSGYTDLIRIFTTASLNEQFDLIRQMEEFLRSEIDRLEAAGKTPDDFALRVMRTKEVLPTSDLKMKNVRVTGQSFDCEILPKQGKFNFDRKEELSENLQHIERQILLLSGEPTKKGGSWVWKNVSLEWAQEAIEGMKLPKDPFQLIELKRYFQRRKVAARGELSQWSVALIGLNPKYLEKTKASKYSFGGREIFMSKRTRLKGKNNVGFFPAPDDFVIDLDEPVSNFKQNGKLRYNIMFEKRPKNQPLMLIYVFDKNSKASSANREDLFPEGADSEHVVAISIVLPTAEISSEERTAEQKMWSNAFRQTMRDLETDLEEE